MTTDDRIDWSCDVTSPGGPIQTVETLHYICKFFRAIRFEAGRIERCIIVRRFATGSRKRLTSCLGAGHVGTDRHRQVDIPDEVTPFSRSYTPKAVRTRINITRDTDDSYDDSDARATMTAMTIQ